jgi:hypothetical protein
MSRPTSGKHASVVIATVAFTNPLTINTSLSPPFVLPHSSSSLIEPCVSIDHGLPNFTHHGSNRCVAAEQTPPSRHERAAKQAISRHQSARPRYRYHTGVLDLDPKGQCTSPPCRPHARSLSHRTTSNHDPEQNLTSERLPGLHLRLHPQYNRGLHASIHSQRDLHSASSRTTVVLW